MLSKIGTPSSKAQHFPLFSSSYSPSSFYTLRVCFEVPSMLLCCFLRSFAVHLLLMDFVDVMRLRMTINEIFLLYKFTIQ